MLDKITEDKLEKIIAGEITLSDAPGQSIKKWRETFGIMQTELAKALEVSPSVVSDYESGRRKSPGINFIKRIVTKVLDIDRKKGGAVIKTFERIWMAGPKKECILDIAEFASPVKVRDFSDAIDGVCFANEEKLDKEIYGYTVVDAIKAIVELSVDELVSMYGQTTERVLVFTNVNYGRSPMVAIRVTTLKPAAVVIQGPADLDPIAIKIAQLENIPLILTHLGSAEDVIKKIRGRFG